jgi:hypothetical protein
MSGQAIPAKPMIVKVENGQRVPFDMIVPNFEWWLQGHTFNIDARVLDLAAYDLYTRDGLAGAT